MIECNETQLMAARAGRVTDAMRQVADAERVPVDQLREGIARGRIVIPANPAHQSLVPVGIGEGLRTKVNVNLGRSQTSSGLDAEIEKVRISLQYGADAVMDLSTGPDIDRVRLAVIAACTAPIGTVPIYQAVDPVEDVASLTADDFLGMMEHQAAQGVDFMTLHAGILFDHLRLARPRLTGIVSRGGALMACWMLRNHAENPFYERFDDVLAIAARHDVTLSLGDGLRPGCLHDASDAAQFAELDTLGELTQRAWAAGVQVMIEGPGHVPFHQIADNVQRQKAACHGAPFYVLGPLVTDIAPGYDHITAAIGATAAAVAGADFLCYVTPMEHLGLPDLEDVRQGLVAFRIAAHAADVARGLAGARDADDAMARARFDFDWERQFALALDPERARQGRAKAMGDTAKEATHYCSMCGPKYCPMRVMQEIP